MAWHIFCSDVGDESWQAFWSIFNLTALLKCQGIRNKFRYPFLGGTNDRKI
jgi:hypothetical protein